MKRKPLNMAPGSFSDNPKSAIQNPKWLGIALVVALAIVGAVAEAQQTKAYRVGVIHHGGPYKAVVDGFRDGLRQLGLEEGKHFLLDIRDSKGDVKAVEEAAKVFERERVNLIFAVTTSAVTPVKNVTSDIPIVFSVGNDPVGSGFVQSFAKPGGRLTGVQYSTTDLTGKRLEILKEMLPKLSRVLTFYNPNNRNAVEAVRLAREAARHFGIEVVERHATSVDELRQRVAALKAREADAYFYTTDAMVISQAQLVIDVATSKRLPTMFSEQNLVVNGGLASYGVSYHEAGRLSAKYVQRILTGTRPQDLPVETVRKLDLVVNLRTAREIGLTIPPNVLARADKVIR
jgi:putative tryptophan/tyrosine transport system substrate-binding protein